jgi:hypothetical protein
LTFKKKSAASWGIDPIERIGLYFIMVLAEGPQIAVVWFRVCKATNLGEFAHDQSDEQISSIWQRVNQDRLTKKSPGAPRQFMNKVAALPDMTSTTG